MEYLNKIDEFMLQNKYNIYDGIGLCLLGAGIISGSIIPALIILPLLYLSMRKK